MVNALTRRPLALERLEARETPATSGVAWPDAEHLTLSFVPDGTPVGRYTSNLFAELNATADTAAWQREILRAFQAWAQYADVNVGVVPDSGAPLGTPGAVQGDARFGDIRIAAAPLPPGTLMTNTSFQWSGTTWSGDVVINTNYQFSAGQGDVPGAYDLYTAALNEAGNVFGVLDSRTDVTSAVYYQYVGAKAGLNDADVADIRSLYGARPRAGFDSADWADAPAAGPAGRRGGGEHADDSPATATVVPLAGTRADARFDYDHAGSIGDAHDVDYYRVQAARGATKMNVLVWAAGASALVPEVTVYDGSRRPVSATLLGNEGGTYSVEVANPRPGATYYVAVAAQDPAGDHGTGGYELGIDFNTQPSTTSQTFADGALTRSARQTDQAFAVSQNRLYQFVLAADGAARAGVTMDVLDADGQVVFSLSAEAGRPAVSGHVYLAAGDYTIRFTAAGPLRGADAVTFTLTGHVASDPIGPGYTRPPVQEWWAMPIVRWVETWWDSPYCL